MVRLDVSSVRGIFALALIAGCSSSDATNNGGNPPVISSVTVAPGSFSVNPGGTQQFTATAYASGTATNATFTWGATGGTINSSGLFTAGASVGAAKAWATTAGYSDTARGNVVAVGGTQVDTVFYEGFESGSFATWDDRGIPGNQSITGTTVHTGAKSLEVLFPSGSDGGWLTKFFMPGYDSIYASYWVYFQSGWQNATKLLSFYGSRTDNQWSATGKAGVCPNGTDYFGMVVSEYPNGAAAAPTRFYTYYNGMAQSPPGSGVCYGLDGQGIGATYTPPLEIPSAGWHHLEFYVVLNTPGQSNLTQKFCIDGVVRGTWSGISVRTSNILKLNAVTITNSIALGSPQTQKMWVDDLLVTRQRPPGAC